MDKNHTNQQTIPAWATNVSRLRLLLSHHPINRNDGVRVKPPATLPWKQAPLERLIKERMEKIEGAGKKPSRPGE